MKTYKKLLIVAAVAACASQVNAQVFRHFDFQGGFEIGSGNSAFVDVTGMAGFQITDVNVNINITGTTIGGSYFPAANGDFYAYLTHGEDISILLNRVGRDPLNDSGYGKNDGMNVTLNDQASPNVNIHVYETVSPYDQGDNIGQVTGNWVPDGRNVNPNTAVTGDPVTAKLDVFNGDIGDGTWTLFIQDMNPSLGVGTLLSWSIDITVVPEPKDFVLVSGLLLLGFAGYRRFATRTA